MKSVCGHLALFCLVGLVAACTSESAKSNADVAKEPEAAPKSTPAASCGFARAKDIPALCTAWKIHRGRTAGPIRVDACDLLKNLHGLRSGDYRLSVLEAVYFRDKQHLDHYLVLHDGMEWQVVADLGELFGKDPGVSILGGELIAGAGGSVPLIRLDAMQTLDVPMDCLSATETIRSVVLCGKRQDVYRCVRIDTLRQLEAEIAGQVHPASSSYKPKDAQRCRTTLDKHGLSPESNEWTLLERTENQVRFLQAGRISYSPGGKIVQVDAGQLLDEGSCQQTGFE